MKGAKPAGLKVIQGGVVDAPEPPKHLPADVHKDWYIVTTDLINRRMMAAATLSVVENYCFALHQVRECQKVITELGVFVRGKDGVPKSNPANTMMQKAQDTMNRLSVELGLTPNSRIKKGMSGGGAQKDSSGIEDFI